MKKQIAKKKILIGVPSLGDVDMSCAMSLVSMIGYTLKMTPHILAPAFVTSSLLPELRNTFVQMAKDANADYLLFIDADMKFPHDMLIRMLEHDVDIVTTNYVTKSETMSKYTATGLDGMRFETKREMTGLSEISLGATGTMLINMKVFDNLRKPYFWLFWDEVNQRAFGEDYYFCHKARCAGNKVWIDNDLTKQVFHIGRKEYNIEDAIRCLPYYDNQRIVEANNGILAKGRTKGNNRKVKRRNRSNKRRKH